MHQLLYQVSHYLLSLYSNNKLRCIANLSKMQHPLLLLLLLRNFMSKKQRSMGMVREVGFPEEGEEAEEVEEAVEAACAEEEEEAHGE